MTRQEREEALFHTDLKLDFRAEAELCVGGGDLLTVSGRDNLLQALTLRLLIQLGELGPLSHPRYGSRIHELVGETLDRANLELLSRYVRKALLQDSRVQKVLSVTARPREGTPGAVEVIALVQPSTGEALQVEVAVDVG